MRIGIRIYLSLYLSDCIINALRLPSKKRATDMAARFIYNQIAKS